MKFATELIEADAPSIVTAEPFLVIDGQPEVLGARYRVGDFIQQFLAARAIALQLFDRADPLLQNLFLLFKSFHLQLDLFQFGLLRRQRLDSLGLIRQLRLPRMVRSRREPVRRAARPPR